MIKHGLDLVVDGDSRVLILGTLPGECSLRHRRYYSDSRNFLWEILSEVQAEPIGSDYKLKLNFLRRKRLALWDVLRRAARIGSLDSGISEPELNNFLAFFEDYPQLQMIVFNGSKAQTRYRRHVLRKRRAPCDSLRTVVLPSTSLTPGRHVLPHEEKVARWKACLTSALKSKGSVVQRD